jgi:hypothetical protein
VWTTLQLCDAGSKRAPRTSGFHYPAVIPTIGQYRFMVWDAIINGARGLNFFGGYLDGCMSSADQAAGWNWTAWSHVTPTLHSLGHMRGALLGHRRALRPHRHWQRMLLAGPSHAYVAAVNTVTFRVSIRRVR